MPNTRVYYVSTNGTRKGPFNIDELRNSDIYEDTLVWEASFDSWREAKDVGELQELIKKSPPPLPALDINTKSHKNVLPKEDINAIVALGIIYIVGHCFFPIIIYASFGGVFLTTLGISYLWFVFKKLVDKTGTPKAIFWIYVIIISTVVFGFIRLYGFSMNLVGVGFDLASHNLSGNSGISQSEVKLTNIAFASAACVIAIMISCIRLITLRKMIELSLFPLMLTTTIMTAVSYCTQVLLLWEIFDILSNEDMSSIIHWACVIAAIPTFSLFLFFTKYIYKSEII